MSELPKFDESAVHEAQHFIERQMLENPELLAPKFLYLLLQGSQENYSPELYNFCELNEKAMEKITLNPAQRKLLKKAGSLDFAIKIDKEEKNISRREALKALGKYATKMGVYTGVVSAGSTFAKFAAKPDRNSMDLFPTAMEEASGLGTAMFSIIGHMAVTEDFGQLNSPEEDYATHTEKIQKINQAEAGEAFKAILARLEPPLRAELAKINARPAVGL